MTGWSVTVGGETIATVSPEDMDRLYDAIVEARACTHQPVTKRIRSISHGI